jgi:hypothetical protein
MRFIDAGHGRASVVFRPNCTIQYAIVAVIFDAADTANPFTYLGERSGVEVSFLKFAYQLVGRRFSKRTSAARPIPPPSSAICNGNPSPQRLYPFRQRLKKSAVLLSCRDRHFLKRGEMTPGGELRARPKFVGRLINAHWVFDAYCAS